MKVIKNSSTWIIIIFFKKHRYNEISVSSLWNLFTIRSLLICETFRPQFGSLLSLWKMKETTNFMHYSLYVVFQIIFVVSTFCWLSTALQCFLSFARVTFSLLMRRWYYFFSNYKCFCWILEKYLIGSQFFCDLNLPLLELISFSLSVTGENINYVKEISHRIFFQMFVFSGRWKNKI